MRYSLVSRFKGSVLGAILGENIALRGKGSQNEILHWSQISILTAESLITLGKFDANDWRDRQRKEGVQLKNDVLKILATLPVAFFFHEDLIKLRHNLLLAAELWQDNPMVRDGMLAVGYALAQSLMEKLIPRTLIPQIISFLGETPTNLPQELLKVNHFLESGTGLARVQTELNRADKPSYAIAMAFYCFLSSGEDFRLSVLRASQNGNVCQSISALTGALSGAYNSTIGIPVIWQVLLEQEQANSYHMLQLVDALVAVWSGVYDLATSFSEFRQEKCAIGQGFSTTQAIAAPRVIRLR
ncbi:MAG: ADP-ribosylglycohydrolase family protein [Scytonema sp. PMC 1069.18]|nr:ADP-ribosylglycohydrolase family protein [Scytonema sp. PMC 1069.18]MEC4886395.1 ADP-ribosylglycohydrolase family protein [Scytonema sp. PMC 1070.18]